MFQKFTLNIHFWRSFLLNMELNLLSWASNQWQLEDIPMRPYPTSNFQNCEYNNWLFFLISFKHISGVVIKEHQGCMQLGAN